jgi:hypothetical protein
VVVVAWLGGNWLRVAAYALAAAAAFWWGWRERRRRAEDPSLWPTFWFMTGGLLLLMAIGRGTDIGDWAAALGRREAVARGWYDQRRALQALAVGSVGVIWLIVVVVALWSVPARRRRYLPAALVVFSLLCFVGARAVSLHQVDSLLYRRQIQGVQIGALLELTGIVIAILVITCWHPRPRAVATPAPPPPVSAGARSGDRR